MIYQLNENGTMAIVLPHGVLFRGAAEGKIRQYLVGEKNYLDAVIGLPANLFYGTSIPTCILVFKKCREDDQDIFFIDASKDFEKVKTQNKLRPKDIDKIINTYANREEIEKYSHKATLKEIHRILKKGGIFAAIDADYPPVINKDLEILNNYLRRKTAIIEKRENKWATDKSDHLKNIRESKLFEYSREICFDHIEEYDQERFKKFLLSQSSMQHAIKYNYKEIADDLSSIDDKLYAVFKGQSLNARYSYRMRIGIK
jgi:type I restriction-modification system DNA methylase subunit